VTQQRQAEWAIQTSAQHYRSLFDNMLNGFAYCRMVFVDGNADDFIYLEVNRAFEALTGLHDVVGKPVSEVIPGIRDSSPDLFALYARVARTGVPESSELYVEGLHMWFAVSVYSPARDHFVSVFDVITERKQAEQAIRASLREKEALLKEVHHRVKNNLQVVTSLLRLEAGRSDDVLVQRTLREMQNRVMSMALIHETLYRSGDFARIDLAAYLTHLAHHVFGAVAHGSHVVLELDMQPASVELEQAVPCGLLVNELISNALKHGFPDGRSGKVRVELRQVDGGSKVRLTVSDNGVGLPVDFPQRRTRSLGLQLAADLARQLRGTLDIGEKPGAGFSLTFTPRTPIEPRHVETSS
jgi:PAS domain S-box-containing protein